MYGILLDGLQSILSSQQEPDLLQWMKAHIGVHEHIDSPTGSRLMVQEGIKAMGIQRA